MLMVEGNEWTGSMESNERGEGKSCVVSIDFTSQGEKEGRGEGGREKTRGREGGK